MRKSKATIFSLDCWRRVELLSVKSQKKDPGRRFSRWRVMPPEKYDFAPTNGEFKGLRTFAQQLKHLASATYEMVSVILGENPPVETGGENGLDRVEGKDAVVVCT